MSGTLNKVMLIGHTGDDVKMHYFEGGGSIGRFPIATNESYTNKATGEKITNTEWHSVVVKNKGAEICELNITIFFVLMLFPFFEKSIYKGID